jgi:hypothetical protein
MFRFNLGDRDRYLNAHFLNLKLKLLEFNFDS